MNNNNIKIAVASGKGGTGKTMFSTSLFYTISKKYSEVALVDCDAEEPNCILFFDVDVAEKIVEVRQQIPEIDTYKCTYCSRCHDYCSYNAIFILPGSKFIKVIEELCHSCGACKVACRYGAISERDVVVGQISIFNYLNGAQIVEARMKSGAMTPVPIIKSAHKLTSKVRIKIMDAPPGTSCPFIHTVYDADYVILITEPTPFGLSDLRQSVETLKLLDKHYGVVVNKAGIGNDEVYEYLEDEDIELLAEIKFDKEYARIYSNGGILAKHNLEIESLLSDVFEKIIKTYGNCSD